MIRRPGAPRPPDLSLYNGLFDNGPFRGDLAMVLTGKWLVIRMGLRDALVDILGVDGDYPTQSVMVGGWVAGETAQLGLWLRVETISDVEGAEWLSAPAGEEPPAHLVRWELIPNGIVYESRTMPEQTVRPHQRETAPD